MTQSPTFTGITPLRYPDGDAAVAWLTRVLGLGPSRSVRDSEGRLSEGEVRLGPARVDLNGGTEPGPASGAGALLIVGVADIDVQYRRIRDAGVEVDPPRDEPYGRRTCNITDPWGYRWYFWEGEARYPSQ